MEYQLEGEIITSKKLNQFVINWVKEMQCEKTTKQFNFLNDYDWIINFNYSNLLETLYKIKRNKIIYIHGKADENEIFFGHDAMENNLSINSRVDSSPHNLNWLMHQYNKSVDKNINKIKNILTFNKALTVDIFGHSLGAQDKRYFELVKNKKIVRNFNIGTKNLNNYLNLGICDFK